MIWVCNIRLQTKKNNNRKKKTNKKNKPKKKKKKCDTEGPHLETGITLQYH